MPSSRRYTDPPNHVDKYQPRYDGRRPSWGFFVRHATGITFDNCTVAVEAGKDDKRPAVVMDDVRGAKWVTSRDAHDNGGSSGSALPPTGPNGCALMVRNVNVSSSDFSGVGSAPCPWVPKEAQFN